MFKFIHLWPPKLSHILISSCKLYGLHHFITLYYNVFQLSLVFVGLVKEVGRVRVDSWNLLGLVGGFLLFCILRTCGRGFM